MIRPHRKPVSEQMRSAIEEIGGEPLEGSGFQDEAPELGFIQVYHLRSGSQGR